jgi:hypothetical protein
MRAFAILRSLLAIAAALSIIIQAVVSKLMSRALFSF